jgi:hypothetical protein
VIKGLNYDFGANPYSGDHVATLDFVNSTTTATAQTAVYEQLTNQEFQRFGASNIANSFTIKNLTTNLDKFVITADLPVNTVTF